MLVVDVDDRFYWDKFQFRLVAKHVTSFLQSKISNYNVYLELIRCMIEESKIELWKQKVRNLVKRGEKKCQDSVTNFWYGMFCLSQEKENSQLLLFSISVDGIVKRWDSFMHAINWFDSIAERQFRFNLIFVVWPFFKCAMSCSRVVVFICKIERLTTNKTKQKPNKITEKKWLSHGTVIFYGCCSILKTKVLYCWCCSSSRNSNSKTTESTIQNNNDGATTTSNFEPFGRNVHALCMRS